MNVRDKTIHEAGGLMLYGTRLSSRVLVGTAAYPSPEVMASAVKAAGAEIVTVSLRREAAGGQVGQRFLEIISNLAPHVLPNTAGCKTARDAVTTAQMARELFGTNWIKLEVIANDDTLQPEVFGLVEAAGVLTRDGFKVFPYTTEDLSVAERLLRAGWRTVSGHHLEVSQTRAAEYRWLQDRPRCRHHRANGARIIRHRLGQA